jgi:hypothetical protein
MKPGRELDKLIAERVMGQTVGRKNFDGFGGRAGDPIILTPGGPYNWEECPDYSTDIAAAWEVVEKLLAEPGKGFEISVGHMFKRHKDKSETKYWECFIEDEKERRFIEEADTAPHAICLAALKAVGEAPPEVLMEVPGA